MFISKESVRAAINVQKKKIKKKCKNQNVSSFVLVFVFRSLRGYVNACAVYLFRITQTEAFRLKAEEELDLRRSLLILSYQLLLSLVSQSLSLWRGHQESTEEGYNPPTLLPRPLPTLNAPKVRRFLK